MAEVFRAVSCGAVPKAVLFDLFETLITESVTRPAPVSALAPRLECEPDAFRARWKAVRAHVVAGRLSFAHSLRDIARASGRCVSETTLQQICAERIEAKKKAFGDVDAEVLAMLDHLRRRRTRLGIISNCFAEDVTAWAGCELASRFELAMFSFEVGIAKPNRAIYVEALRRLRVDAADAWFVGDGSDDELSGAESVGLRALRAVWFRQRWPHFKSEPGAAALVAAADICALTDANSRQLNKM